MSDPFGILVPTRDLLPAYTAALEAGWSPDNVNGLRTTRRQLDWIARDPDGFIASLDDPEGRGAPIEMPDGTIRQRLPGYIRWIWDGDFCGTIGFRWQPGTAQLPSHVLGHSGYAVVPWKRGHGYAARAVTALLPDARARGLPYLEITTDEDNIASRRTIERCGGLLVERFRKDAAYGDAESLRYRIML